MATIEDFKASTEELVVQVEALIAKISAMVGTEDEQAAGHAADALTAKNAAQAAAAAAHQTLLDIQELDVNQGVVDVGLAEEYKNAADASADAAAADKLTIQGLVTEVTSMRDLVADALAQCLGVVAIANSAQAALATTTTAQAAINTGMANIVIARDAAVAAAQAAQASAALALQNAELAHQAALENIREMVDHSVLIFPIHQTVIRVDMPQSRYSVAEPVVVCVVNGAPTNVQIVCSAELVTGVGEVFTYVTFTFPPSAVGKKCNAWISG